VKHGRLGSPLLRLAGELSFVVTLQRFLSCPLIRGPLPYAGGQVKRSASLTACRNSRASTLSPSLQLHGAFRSRVLRHEFPDLPEVSALSSLVYA